MSGRVAVQDVSYDASAPAYVMAELVSVWCPSGVWIFRFLAFCDPAPSFMNFGMCALLGSFSYLFLKRLHKNNQKKY